MSTEELDSRIAKLDRILTESQDSYFNNDKSKRLTKEKHLEIWDELYVLYVLKKAKQKDG